MPVRFPNDPSRRAFVLGAAAAATLARAELSVGAGRPDDRGKSLLELGAVEAIARMVRGELAAEHYAAALLERCRATASLNAFIALEPERVLEAARECDRSRRAGKVPGPLFGLPIPVKDSVNTKDYPTTAGTPALRHFRPSADAPLIERLRAAGAVVLGKTNLHELSYGWTSNNHAFGAVRNPYARARIPGGSSGGTAAAIAARMAPLGVAEDTEGSIRVPAAMCGIVGFRPTTGRYPTHGCVPIAPLFDQVGPHARAVADVALFDGVAARDASPLPAVSLKGVRIGLVRDYFFTDLDPEVERLTHQVLERLTAAGAVLIETQLPDLPRLIDLTTDAVQNHDVRIFLAAFLREYGAGVSFDEVLAGASDDIQAVFRRDVLPGGPGFVAESVYAAARDEHLPALRRMYADYFARSGVAAMLFPATLVPPPAIGDEGPQRIGARDIPFDVAVARNIAPGSTAGIPGLVLPAGLTSAGLPVAIELDAPGGADRALLGLGLALERALGPIPAPTL
jgi:Asp-tRNA(Asn)/Glu-tRNA(Gln) amidotransferase A subunit family amidase